MTPAPHWEQLLASFPTYPGDVLAVPEPTWDDLGEQVEHIRPKGRDRAIARYVARESTALFNDARLEGLGFTQPEIVTLLRGGHVAGHTAGEGAQVTGLKRASGDMTSAQVNESAAARRCDDGLRGCGNRPPLLRPYRDSAGEVA